MQYRNKQKEGSMKNVEMFSNRKNMFHKMMITTFAAYRDAQKFLSRLDARPARNVYLRPDTFPHFPH